MAHVYVKLMAKGKKYHDHEMFPFQTTDNSTIQDLANDLQSAFRERFQVFLDDNDSQKLRRETIVLVNGANVVSKQGLKTRVSDGDLIVFMIAAVGG
jgi:molybdopterin converting factor small subunit